MFFQKLDGRSVVPLIPSMREEGFAYELCDLPAGRVPQSTQAMQ